MRKKYRLSHVLDKGKCGGAAIEYIIVSTFATAMAIAAVMLIHKIFQEKVTPILQDLGIDAGDLPIDPFIER